MSDPWGFISQSLAGVLVVAVDIHKYTGAFASYYAKPLRTHSRELLVGSRHEKILTNIMQCLSSLCLSILMKFVMKIGRRTPTRVFVHNNNLC